jgi:hypothetical protein
MFAAKKINKKNIYNQKDGLVDIYIGLLILFISLLIRADIIWMAAILPSILTPAFRTSRDRLLSPALKEDELKSHIEASETIQKTRFTRLFLGLLLTGVLTFLIFVVFSSSDTAWFHDIFPLYMGIVFTGTYWSVAAILRQPRFIIYGLNSLLCMIAVYIDWITLEIGLGWIGGLMIAIGIIILVRFIKDPQSYV